MAEFKKKCPMCAEMVKLEARICRFCRHEFEANGHADWVPPSLHSATPSPNPETSQRARNGSMGCLAILGLFVLVALFKSDEEPQSNIIEPVSAEVEPVARTESLQTADARDAQKEPDAVVVTAEELTRAYDSNEAAAQRRFGDRPLRVSGRVRAIELDFSDEPYLLLRGLTDYDGPKANLIDDAHSRATSLEKGQQVQLRCGSVSEILGVPILEECGFIEG